MLTIRDAQMEALGSIHLERVLIEHVAAFFPQQTNALGEDGTREAVRQSRERAETHGFTRNADIWRFVDLVFAFGLDFDTEQTWASAVLRSPGHELPTHRLDRLCEAAMDYLDAAVVCHRP